MEGRPHPLFQRWLQHPAYDSFWQHMVPYQDEFAAIHIPILTTTGYFDDDQLGALYYYRQHLLHYPAANHYLVIGPWDHYGAQAMNNDTLTWYLSPVRTGMHYKLTSRPALWPAYNRK